MRFGHIAQVSRSRHSYQRQVLSLRQGSVRERLLLLPFALDKKETTTTRLPR